MAAIDLPGFGNSVNAKRPKSKKLWLQRIKRTIFPSRRIILVSPSMSGAYSLPFLFERQKSVAGFVPIAPVATSSFSTDDYKTLSVPTMIVYGDRDRRLGLTSRRQLSKIFVSYHIPIEHYIFIAAPMSVHPYLRYF